MSKRIQLNADLGEGAQVESLLMPYLSYCNIACGGHYGNESSMNEVIELSKTHQVKIGAHPSYPDKENFGRVPLDISTSDLEISLRSQLLDFKKVCSLMGAQVHHVKAHGALYHQIVIDKNIRDLFTKLVFQILGEVKLMLPAHVNANELDLDETMIIYEAFADRRYDYQGQLMPRSKNNAILQGIEEIEDQITLLSLENKVLSNTGAALPIRFDSICIHGDHPQIKTYFPKLIKNLIAKGLLPCD